MIQDTKDFVKFLGCPSIRILRAVAHQGVSVGVKVYQEHSRISTVQAHEELSVFRWYNTREMEEDLSTVQKEFPEYFL